MMNRRAWIPIVVGREADGRWWADIEAMPGVMAYGETRDLAIAVVRALALRAGGRSGLSHHRLKRAGWPNYTFAFHDDEEVGPGLLAQIAKKTVLQLEDL